MRIVLILDEKNSFIIHSEPIKSFRKLGLETEAWEFRKLNPEFNESNVEILQNPQQIVHRDFKEKREFIYALDTLQGGTVFLTGNTIKPWNKFIYKELKNRKIPYIVARRNTHPLNIFKKIHFDKPDNLHSLIDFYKTKLTFLFRRSIQPLYHFYKNKGICIKRGINKPLMIFYGTINDKILIGNQFPSCSSTYYIHHADYDEYLEKKDTPISEDVVNEGKFGVLIDAYCPLHPELLKKNINIDPTEYYNRIEFFLKKIEDHSKIKILVAAHPISNMEILSQLLPNRTIYMNRTYELIRNASFCLTHFSTAISWAVLFEKPFIFINTNLFFNQPYLLNVLTNYSKSWNKKLFYIEEFHMNEEKISCEISSIDKKKYEKYKRRFLKKENTPEVLFWDFVASKLAEHFKESSK